VNGSTGRDLQGGAAGGIGSRPVPTGTNSLLGGYGSAYGGGAMPGGVLGYGGGLGGMSGGAMPVSGGGALGQALGGMSGMSPREQAEWGQSHPGQAAPNSPYLTRSEFDDYKSGLLQDKSDQYRAYQMGWYS